MFAFNFKHLSTLCQIRILSFLEHREFEIVYNAMNYTYPNIERIYEERLLYNCNNHVMKLVFEEREQNKTTWKELYYRVIEVFKDYYSNKVNMYWLTRTNKLLELKIVCNENIFKHNMTLSIYDANQSCMRNNSLEILKWLQTKGLLPDQDGLLYAVCHQNINVLKWLLSICDFYLPTQDLLHRVLAQGNLEICKLFYSYGIIPDNEGMRVVKSYALIGSRKHLEILNWFRDINIIKN